MPTLVLLDFKRSQNDIMLRIALVCGFLCSESTAGALVGRKETMKYSVKADKTYTLFGHDTMLHMFHKKSESHKCM